MEIKKMKRIILSICLLILVACSNKTEKDYYERLKENSNKTNDRINLYGNYKKDKFPVSKSIPYLNYVSDMENPRVRLTSYNQKDFLKFYKNTKAKGNGDNSSYWRWKVTLTKKEMSNILNKNLVDLYRRRPKEVLTYSNNQWVSKKLPLNPIGDIIEVKVLQRAKSGLAIKLLLKGTRGEYLVVKEGNIRNALGMSKRTISNTINLLGAKGGSSSYNEKPLSKNPSMLPSAFIAIEKLGSGGFSIYGGGFGHGSGVPQWSAMDLTKNKGYTYKKVLQRYYSNVKLQNIKSIDGISSKIRVGIMTSGFSTIDHTKISMVSKGSLKIKSKDGNITVNPNTIITSIVKNGYTEVIVSGKIKLKTKNNITISSKEMISITNLKRNIRGYKSPTYRGTFEIRLAKNGTRLNLINEILIEDYLLQVVPSEMPKSFGLEALKVQAIAARTYAAKDIIRNRYSKLGFHILDSTQSQVYNNLDENDLTNKAVKSTKGIILTHQNKPIDAKYYSTSSGFNSSAHNVW